MHLSAIPVFPKNALHNHSELPSHRFPDRPVSRCVGAHRFHQFVSDCFECRISQHFHSAVVDLQGVIEDDRIIRLRQVEVATDPTRCRSSRSLLNTAHR